jgi:hypothetical protein
MSFRICLTPGIRIITGTAGILLPLIACTETSQEVAELRTRLYQLEQDVYNISSRIQLSERRYLANDNDLNIRLNSVEQGLTYQQNTTDTLVRKTQKLDESGVFVIDEQTQ